MTKKYITVSVVLLLVLALIAAAYAILKSGNSDVIADDAHLYVNTQTASDMKELSYDAGEGELILVKNANDGWYIPSEPDLPLNNAYVGNMSNAVSGLEAVREVVSDDESEFGFDTPRLNVKATYKNGDVLSLTLGAENRFNGETYLKDNTNGKVYLIDTDLAGAFSFTRETLIALDSFPLVSADEALSIRVKNADGDEETVTEDVGLTDAASIFLSLGFSSDNALFASSGKLDECGIASSGASAELTYITGDSENQDEITTETFELLFGCAYEENGEKYYYYTAPGALLIYKADEASYSTLMRYATYAASEKGE